MRQVWLLSIMEEKKVTNGVTQPMINKFILAISFLFIFSGSANCEEQKVKREFKDAARLKTGVSLRRTRQMRQSKTQVYPKKSLYLANFLGYWLVSPKLFSPAADFQPRSAINFANRFSTGFPASSVFDEPAAFFVFVRLGRRNGFFLIAIFPIDGHPGAHESMLQHLFNTGNWHDL